MIQSLTQSDQQKAQLLQLKVMMSISSFNDYILTKLCAMNAHD